MILGKKTRFRSIEESDLPFLVEWMNDPEISHLIGGWSYPVSMVEQKEWFHRSIPDKTTQRWIVERDDGDVIGLTGLWQIDLHNRHALTGLKLGPKAIRGRGYGTDAILTLMSYAFFQVGLNRLWTTILPYNVGSYKAYVKKCGWKIEGMDRQHVFRDGVFYDQYRVGVLRQDFLALAAGAEYLPAVETNRVEVAAQDLASDPSLT